MAERDERERNRAEPLHEHAAAAGAPGASGPGEPGYEGEATLNTQGGDASPISYDDPQGDDEEVHIREPGDR